jgi:hypothetical protein
VGSSPTRPTSSFNTPGRRAVDRIVYRYWRGSFGRRAASGHIEQLLSGCWRAKVYAGTDPLTGREIRFRKTCKTERSARIELGKLLPRARSGRQSDSDVTRSLVFRERGTLTCGYGRRTLVHAVDCES